jgi:two-component system cell cycle response regulator
MIFRKMVQQTKKGICISRMHPKRVADEFEIEDVPIYWLSSERGDLKNVVAPTFLPQLNTIIIDFIQKNKNGIILLEGIEYLIDQNDFKAILSLVHSLNDYIMNSDAILLIPLDPLILKENEVHILSRDLKVL